VHLTVRGVVVSLRDRKEVVVESSRLTLSVPETAALLGISRALAYQLVARGELPSLRLGGRILVPRHALDRLVGEVEPGVA
jgi:excisionase family DNA binding protein